ncbi:MAG: DUF87 domain-containing protein [Anaerolineae bacterium]
MLTSLRGSFPGIGAGPADTQLGTQLNQARFFAHLGRMSGIPTCKSAPIAERQQEGTTQQIERLLRALRGEEWGYFVFARPVNEGNIAQLTQGGLDKIKQYGALVKKNVQTGPGAQSEQTDRQAQYCVELLEKNLARLLRGKAEGMWQSEVHFFAQHGGTLARLRTLLRAIYAGSDSIPDPVRTFVCLPNLPATRTDPLITLVNSRELATLSQLPREEFSGYAVQDYARFAVARDDRTGRLPSEQLITVGKILDHGEPTGDWYVLPRIDLAKHGLVVGVTGSGKTNTVFHILNQVWNGGKGRPFLVVEPAKSEYRDLQRVGGLETLRIYTLGDERYAPFRLNPFEFEIQDEEHRVHVQTHIDYLKSVFNASFILYAPMPYVLEQCLHEIYTDKGWDLTSNRNRRVPPNPPGQENMYNVFPTLTDLYRKIDEVTDRLGYEERIQMDVKAGLKARVESLRLGGKGVMLDTPHSLKIHDLLSHPTVLELERVGDDEEKAFLMGLLLTRIYEYRTVQSKRANQAQGFQHLTVIEEAHRLLKNVPTDVSTEASNVKGKAVETFANMLSEIRAYGEGVLIAEQIPTKLATDAIKNTNVKILHRVVALDDREAVGSAMNMEEEQLRAVMTFESGQAAIYAEGNHAPFLAEVYSFKSNHIKSHLTDEDVRRAMQSLVPTSSFDSRIRDIALAVTQRPDFREWLARYIHSMLFRPMAAIEGYNELRKLIKETESLRSPDEERAVASCVTSQGATQWFEDKGRRYGWLYNSAETLRELLDQIISTVIMNYKNDQVAMQELASRLEQQISTFQKGYVELCKKGAPPYEGCFACRARCLYRYDVLPYVKDESIKREFAQIIQKTQPDNRMWQVIAAQAIEIGERLIKTGQKQDAQGVALCYVAQMGNRMGFSRAIQHKLTKNALQAMIRP